MIKRRLIGLVCVALLLLSALPVATIHAANGTQPYVGLRKHTTAADFAGSTRRGVNVADVNGAAHVTLDGPNTLLGMNKKRYGVKSYWYGTLTSPALDAAQLFDTLIPSWNAITPAKTWVQLELSAYRPGDNHWTRFYNLGIWASGSETIARRSIPAQRDRDGFVATDTLVLYGDPVYTRYKYRLTLFSTDRRVTPSLRLISVMASNSAAEAGGLALASDRQAWGTDLAVPQRSQMIYKGGGEVWCSPTSTSMVLAYWGINVAVPDAAAATYDHVYDGNGNWPFNTAWAGSHGLEAYVTRMGSFAQVEEWISAGVPVIMSYAMPSRVLPNAPYSTTRGHIMVIRGFDRSGNVIVNDPAFGADASVRVVYDRQTLEQLWLTHSGGTVYLIYPRGHAVPADNAYGSW